MGIQATASPFFGAKQKKRLAETRQGEHRAKDYDPPVSTVELA